MLCGVCVCVCIITVAFICKSINEFVPTLRRYNKFNTNNNVLSDDSGQE